MNNIKRGRPKKPPKKCEVSSCIIITPRRSIYCAAHRARYYRIGDVQAHLAIGHRLHGQRTNGSSPTYMSWQLMKDRCYNKKSKTYSYYGGRGIKICKRWLDFKLFRLDMGDKPTPLHTLDRLNSDKDYTLKNCRWATRQEQSRARKYCKLSMEKAKLARKMYSKGVLQKDIAKFFNVGTTAISYAILGKTWT